MTDAVMPGRGGAPPAAHAARFAGIGLLRSGVGAISLWLVYSHAVAAPPFPSPYLFLVAAPALFFLQELAGGRRRASFSLLDALPWVYFPAIAVLILCGDWAPRGSAASVVLLLCSSLGGIATAVRIASTPPGPSSVFHARVWLFALIHHAAIQVWEYSAFLAPGKTGPIPVGTASMYALCASVLALVLCRAGCLAGAGTEPGTHARIAARTATLSFLVVLAPQHPLVPLGLAAAVLPAAALPAGRRFAARLLPVASRLTGPVLLLSCAAALTVFFFPGCPYRARPWQEFLSRFRELALARDPFAAAPGPEWAVAALAMAGAVITPWAARTRASSRGTASALALLVAATGAVLAVRMTGPAGPAVVAAGVVLDRDHAVRTFELPAGTTDISLVTSLSHGSSIEQGRVVARVFAPGSLSPPVPLRAGIETAEWSIDRREVRAVTRHRAGRVVFQGLKFDEQGRYVEQRYLATVNLPAGAGAGSLRIELASDLEPPVSLGLHEVRALRR